MGRHMDPETVKTLKVIATHAPVSVVEVAQLLGEPPASVRSRMHTMANRGYLTSEFVKGAGKDYSPTPYARAALGLKAAEGTNIDPALAVAQPRQHSFQMTETWVPPVWDIPRGPGCLAFLGVRSVGASA